MFFYWFLFILLFIIATSKKKNRYKTVFFIMLSVAITRADTVGADLKGGYKALFDALSFIPSTWIDTHNEVGFVAITAFFKEYISSNMLLYYNLLLGLTLILYYKFIRRYSIDPALSLFFMLAFAYYFECFNGMRQQFCDAILLMFIPLLSNIEDVKGKLWLRCSIYSIFVIITCLLVHKSQLVFLVTIPIFLYYRTSIMDTLRLEIYLLAALILSIPIADFAQGQFAQLAILFEDDTSNIGNYLAGGKETFGEYSIMSNAINTFFCMYCVWLHRYKKDPFLCLYVLGLLILDPLTQIYWIFQRLAYVFMFFRVIVYAELWHNIPNLTQRRLYRILLVLYAALMFYRRLVNDDYVDVLPYNNILFGQF